MKKIIPALLILSFCFSGCKKKDVTPPNLNEVKATVVVSPTNTIIINATGTKAKMGCSAFGSGTFIEGTNDANAAVIITYASGSACVTVPETYSFSCEYRKNVADPNTPIFSNNGANPGSITFSVINGNHMEGTFTAIARCNSGGCVFGVDSVIINGTFKGDY